MWRPALSAEAARPHDEPVGRSSLRCEPTARSPATVAAALPMAERVGRFPLRREPTARHSSSDGISTPRQMILAPA